VNHEQFEMAKASEEKFATNATDAVEGVDKLFVPHFWPLHVDLWFTVLECQFKYAHIVRDKTKFNIVIANLGKEHIEKVEDIVLNPPATGQYERLKKELIKRLTPARPASGINKHNVI
jgi:hypothetical protein